MVGWLDSSPLWSRSVSLATVFSGGTFVAEEGWCVGESVGGEVVEEGVAEVYVCVCMCVCECMRMCVRVC